MSSTYIWNLPLLLQHKVAELAAARQPAATADFAALLLLLLDAGLGLALAATLLALVLALATRLGNC